MYCPSLVITVSYQYSSNEIVPKGVVVGITLAWWNMYLSLINDKSPKNVGGGGREVQRGSRGFYRRLAQRRRNGRVVINEYTRINRSPQGPQIDLFVRLITP